MADTRVDHAIVVEYAERYDPLITVEEAAAIARVPIATIHAWSSAKRLDAFKTKVGRRVLFRRDAFVHYILGSAVGTEAGG